MPVTITGLSPKDKEPLVGTEDEPEKHKHGIVPQFMSEPKNSEEVQVPLGFQIHKPPNHPTRYPEHRLGPLPTKPSLEQYQEFMKDSVLGRTTKKIKEAPLVPLGIAGFFGAIAYGIYNFRRAPKHVTASSYFVQLRVIAQSIAVGSIASLAFYQFYKTVIKNEPLDEGDSVHRKNGADGVLHNSGSSLADKIRNFEARTTSSPVKEAEREGKAFLLSTEDTHHKSAIFDDRTIDISADQAHNKIL